MPVSKAQLLAAANEHALELGQPLVSESVLESWISQRLLERAHPRGHKRGVNPTWEFSDTAILVVKEIVSLRALGARRTAQLLICRWTTRANLGEDRIKKALIAEWRRIINRQQRGPHWFEDHYTDLHKLSESERATRVRQLPPLDPDLAASGLSLAPKTFHELALRAYWGEDGNGRIAAIALNGLLQSPEGVLPVPEFLEKALAIGGVIGPEGESSESGCETLSGVTSDDLEEARNMYFCCLGSLGLMAFILSVIPILCRTKLAHAYTKAFDSFSMPEWIIPSISLFAIAAFNIRAARIAHT